MAARRGPGARSVTLVLRSSPQMSSWTSLLRHVGMRSTAVDQSPDDGRQPALEWRREVGVTVSVLWSASTDMEAVALDASLVRPGRGHDKSRRRRYRGALEILEMIRGERVGQAARDKRVRE